jgi:molecular chaperone DnaK
VQRTIGPVRRALKDAGITPSDVAEVVLVGGMTRMPAIQEAVRSFFGKDPHKGVNPDEVVGVGAAIQAGVLGGDVKDVLLLDVTPLTLSIETLGGVATPLIERNTTIPTKKGQVFSTASDSQTQVEIHVVQGERPMAQDNKSLGRFILDGIPPAPRGVPQIEVTFDINADGILNVNARDKATGNQQDMQIIPSSGLSDDEIERMVDEAEQHASDDRERKAAVEARNVADAAIYSAEKFMRENSETIPEHNKQAIETQLGKTRAALESGDSQAMSAEADRLKQVMTEAGAAMYEEQATTSTDGQGPADEAGDEDQEDVIEGEFSDA